MSKYIKRYGKLTNSLLKCKRSTKQNKKRIFQYFNSKKYDIILLQETYSTPQDESVWKKEWEGPAFFSSLNNHKCGVAMLFTNNQNKLKAFYENTYKPGEHLSIKIELEASSFIITNICAPNITQKMKKVFPKTRIIYKK